MICYCRSTIREKIIPHAVSWFTREAVPIDDEEEGDDDAEEEEENDEEENDEEEDDEKGDEENIKENH